MPKIPSNPLLTPLCIELQCERIQKGRAHLIDAQCKEMRRDVVLGPIQHVSDSLAN
jgi:hypothetical protein